MKRTLVKICGLTSYDDAQLCVECGADFIGFVFYAESPRYIEPESAGRIIKKLKESQEHQFFSVGVFVDPPEKYVEKSLILSGIDIFQFHGSESRAFIMKMQRRYPEQKAIRAFRVSSEASVTEAALYPADYVLLDSFSEKARGGTGTAFEWSWLLGFPAADRLFLSGGINPDNVRDAIKKVRPFAVDLSSGVEESPGKKSPVLVRSLFSGLSAAD